MNYNFVVRDNEGEHYLDSFEELFRNVRMGMVGYIYSDMAVQVKNLKDVVRVTSVIYLDKDGNPHRYLDGVIRKNISTMQDVLDVQQNVRSSMYGQRQYYLFENDMWYHVHTLDTFFDFLLKGNKGCVVVDSMNYFYHTKSGELRLYKLERDDMSALGDEITFPRVVGAKDDIRRFTEVGPAFLTGLYQR